MFSQSNINSILDHQHRKGTLIHFSHTNMLAIRMDFFNHFPPESTLEMLAIVPVNFNNNLAVFSSSANKEVSGYATFLNRRFGLEQGKDLVSIDLTNLVFSETFRACLVESVPWLAIMTGDNENFAFFIPEKRYNQIDYVFQQCKLIHANSHINIQTEGEKSGLITLI